MGSCFKVPSVRRSIHEDDGLPKFTFEERVIQEKIGNGAFGEVFRASYRGETVVIKKLIAGSGSSKGFLKEAKLLHAVKGHSNVVDFVAIATKPSFAIMQEHVCFSFQPFGEEKIVNSLAHFLSHVDEFYDFKGFEHMLSLVLQDIQEGLIFLHEKDIVHRDLKPSNILVTNSHYSHLNGVEFAKFWESSPERHIICKLTDFGESRSRLIQTQTLLSSRIEDVNRGSPAYMCPEIILPEERPQGATLADLKAADTWAAGMVCFMLINSSENHPYAAEILREES